MCILAQQLESGMCRKGVRRMEQTVEKPVQGKKVVYCKGKNYASCVVCGSDASYKLVEECIIIGLTIAKVAIVRHDVAGEIMVELAGPEHVDFVTLFSLKPSDWPEKNRVTIRQPSVVEGDEMITIKSAILVSSYI